MANEILGREVTLSIGGTDIGVMRTKTLNINNEAVDVTADGDDGVQRYLDKPGQKAVELTGTLMYDPTDETLIDKALSNNITLASVQLDYTSFTISGDFSLTGYSQGQNYNEAVTADITLSSNGAITKTSTP